MVDTRIDVLKYVQESLKGDFWASQEVQGVITGYLGSIQYQGFDAIETVSVFMKKGDQPVLGSKEKDLAFMLMLFYERGSDITKLSASGKCRMDEQGRKLVQSIKDKYGLVKMGKGANMKSLTLPRLALAFPVQSCLYSTIRKNRPVLFPGPQCITIQAFSALIPANADWMHQTDIDKLIFANAMCMHDLSMIINPEYRVLDVESQKALTIGFIKNGLRSQIVREQDKQQLLLDMKVIDLNLNVVLSVAQLSDRWLLLV